MRLAIGIAVVALAVLLAVFIVSAAASPFGNRIDDGDDACALLDDDAVRELRLPELPPENVRFVGPTCRYDDPGARRSTTVNLDGDTTLSTARAADPFTVDAGSFGAFRTDDYPIQVGPFPGQYYQATAPGPLADCGCAVYFQVAEDLVIKVKSVRRQSGAAVAEELCADTRRVAEAIAEVVG